MFLKLKWCLQRLFLWSCKKFTRKCQLLMVWVSAVIKINQSMLIYLFNVFEDSEKHINQIQSIIWFLILLLTQYLKVLSFIETCCTVVFERNIKLIKIEIIELCFLRLDEITTWVCGLLVISNFAGGHFARF